MYYFIQIFLFINNKEIFTYNFNNFNFTIPIILHKTDYFLTKKGKTCGSCLDICLIRILLFVLDCKFFNKFVLYITRNKFVCRRRHYERSTSTGKRAQCC